MNCMEEKEPNMIKRWTDKLYGGLNMTWLTVILYAVGAAVLTSVFLVLPVFKNTSFERMGVTLEAWIFFAVILMANCKKPLESALKTFVFFIVSQPLIYLIQAPFNVLGWGIFRYYRNWAVWTALTFPMAFVGWYITKKNWLSVLIFSPVLAFLGYTAYETGVACFRAFPHLLIAALFCLMQIALYVVVFFPKMLQKLVGVLIPIIVIVVLAFSMPRVELQLTEPLPGDPSFSEEATVTVQDSSICQAQLHSAEEGIVYIYAHQYGETELRITDGGKETRYSVEVYNDQGIARVRITPA